MSESRFLPVGCEKIAGNFLSERHRKGCETARTQDRKKEKDDSSDRPAEKRDEIWTLLHAEGKIKDIVNSKREKTGNRKRLARSAT